MTRTPKLWSKAATCAFAVGVILLPATQATQAAPAEPRGSADVPWVGRYADSHIVTFNQVAFDDAAFLVRKPKSTTRDEADFLALQGQRTRIVYQVPKGRSSLEVFRNFEQKLLGSGFSSVFGCQLDACGLNVNHLLRPAFGPEVLNTMSFASGFSGAPRYGVFRKMQGGADQVVAIYVGESPGDGPRVAVLALASAGMQANQIVVPTPAEMSNAFASEGKIALYGIFFDSGKADVKPESKPTLGGIAALLNAQPALALVVTGYTDNVGGFEPNLALSKRRAEAVVQALVADFRIPAARLTAFGAGMTGPRGPNTDDAGRAKNRRVELTPR